jgi:hypothetical protein
MILVSLGYTWPRVIKGLMTTEDALLVAWPVRPSEEEQLVRAADVLLGVFRGEVVAAYDITDWRWETPQERAEAAREWRRHFPRVIFEGRPSKRCQHLIGTANPAGSFTRWPVKYLDTVKVQQG